MGSVSAPDLDDAVSLAHVGVSVELFLEQSRQSHSPDASLSASECVGWPQRTEAGTATLTFAQSPELEPHLSCAFTITTGTWAQC